MRKTMMAALLCCILCGCAGRTFGLQEKLNTALAAEQSYPVHQPSYNKKYYSYYIEPCVGRLDASASANLFAYDGSRFLMNINVPAVIGTQSAQTGVLSAPAASAAGTYTDLSGEEKEFSVQVYADSGRAVTVMRTAYMDFCGIGWMADAPELAGMMLRIARTVQVNQAEVAAEYSGRDLITYEGTTMQLFDYIAPESGSIEELFVDSHYVGDISETDFINPSAPVQEEPVIDEKPEDPAENEESNPDK